VQVLLDAVGDREQPGPMRRPAISCRQIVETQIAESPFQVGFGSAGTERPCRSLVGSVVLARSAGRSLHEGFLRELGLSGAQAPVQPTTLAYTSYLLPRRP
jgi:hypothetical protein